MSRILVIDDSSTIRSAIKRILLGLSHEVREAEHGEAALTVVQEDHEVAAILCDIDMPVMDGLTFVSALRTTSSLRQPPVIMCTTHNSFERIGDALGRGANEYIMKPFTEEIIAEKLAAVGIG
jgi:two-component system, chemotaxis family, chemotaxis protein CheY